MTTRSAVLDLIVKLKGGPAAANDLGRVQKSFGGLKETVFSLKGALAGIGAGLVVRSLFSAGVEVQRLNRSLEAITGSSRAAAEELSWLRATSDKLGQEFYSVADSYKGFLAATQDTAVAGETARDIFQATLEASTALGMSVADTEGALRAFTQMVSKGNVQAEELRGQLGERLYGAFNLAAQAMGKSTQELNKMLEQGQVAADVLLPRLARILHEKYGQAALDASNDAQQGLNRFTTAWKDFKAQVGQSGFLTTATDLLKDLTERLKDPEAVQAVTNLANSLAQLGNNVAKFAIPALSRLLELAAKIPPGMYAPGAGAYLGGKVAGPYGAAVGFAGGLVFNEIAKSDIQKIAELERQIQSLQQKAAQSRMDMDGWRGALVGDDRYQQQIDRYTERISDLREEIERIRKAAQAENYQDSWLSHGAVSPTGAFAGQPEKEAPPEPPPEDKKTVSFSDRVKSDIARLQALTETQLDQLDALYARGEVALAEYFSRRRAMIDSEAAATLDALERLAAAETDPTRRLSIETEIYKTEQQYKRDLIALAQEQYEAEERLIEKKRDIASILENLQQRASGSRLNTLTAQFNQELRDLDHRHAEEIARLEELNAEKEYLDEAYRQQKIEKDQLLFDQESRLNDLRLMQAQRVASSMTNLLWEMYEAGDKQSKDLFTLWKAAAMAETIVTTAAAVMKTYKEYSEYPPLAAAMAAITAAYGAAQLAKISQQKLAFGGRVGGSSAHDRADNVPIWATADEWVIQRPTSRYYGGRIMDAINQGAFPRSLLEGWLSGVNVPRIGSGASYALATGGQVPAAPAMGGGYTIGELNFTVQAADAQSFADNPGLVADALDQALRQSPARRRQLRRRL